MEQQNDPFILIYHNIRGKAQVVRYLLCYLDIPFEEVFLGQGETLLDINKKYNLNLDPYMDLPGLINGQHTIQDIYAMMKYLCKKFNREDLVGSDLEERAIIRQIFYSFLLKGCKEIKKYFEFAMAYKHNSEKKQELKKKSMAQSLKVSGSLKQLLHLKTKNNTSKYVLNHLTILDFLLQQGAFYQLNFFGDLEQKQCALLQTLNSVFGTQFSSIKQKHSLILKTLRQFKQNFEEEPFYVRNKQKLQSYCINCLVYNQQMVAALREAWLGQSHFIK